MTAIGPAPRVVCVRCGRDTPTATGEAGRPDRAHVEVLRRHYAPGGAPDDGPCPGSRRPAADQHAPAVVIT